MKLMKLLRRLSRPTALLLAIILSFASIGCSSTDAMDVLDLAGDVLGLLDDTTPSDNAEQTTDNDSAAIDEDGYYYSKDDVALYIHTYGRLPANFITKNEAQQLGWEGGSVEDYAEGCAIGGDTFGNREGLLPKKDGRSYKECDIDTLGKSSRGAKRIVFSNDGLIYYTDDHYETFTLLYGEE